MFVVWTVSFNIHKVLMQFVSDDGITEQEEAKRLLQHRRKRKFLELAVPVGVVALLCLSLCMVYLVETGHTIVVNRKVGAYIYFPHFSPVTCIVKNSGAA